MSNDAARLVSSVGFKWMATDEGILAKSGIDLSWHNRQKSVPPYKRDDLTIFFRDRTLSDLIGFQYMHASASESAGDLIRRMKEVPEGSHVLSRSTERIRGTITRTVAGIFALLV